MTPAVFFDRDGIVNRHPGPGGYVLRADDFHLLPEFVQALRIVIARGYVPVVVTNQRGVGRGLMSAAELEAIHERLRRELAARGLALRDILVCTATDDAHPWRKPRPGMLLEAAHRHDLDLSRSWMIGDYESDVQAGRRAGCRTVRVAPMDEASEADARVPDMAALAAYLDRHLPPARAEGVG
jgi:D-glycero-D-manno-heptose 1,7-bisphosphate phosphatase